MKKLTFLMAILFASAMIYAQNISDVNQAGAQQDANVTQTGSNVSVVGQTNDWTDGTITFIQTADVTQDGANISSIVQESGSTATANNQGVESSAVTQDGSGNSTDVYQYSDNKGPISSTVSQIGNGNTADIDQSNTGGGNNTPLIQASAQQEGHRNYIRQFENAPGSNSGQTEIAIQIGNDNWGEQEILSGHTDYFKLEQRGNFNHGDQQMSGGHNTADIYSEGNLNQAYQTIQGNNFGYSAAEIAIEQIGNSNYSYQMFKQGGTSTANDGTVTQWGNGNTGNQYADAKNVSVTLTQIGNGNDGQVAYNPWIPVFGLNIQPSFDAFYTQYQESDNSSLSIEVYGSNNHTAQYQIGDGPANPNPPPQGNFDNNTASMMIDGNENNAAQYQYGHELESAIDVYGNGNYAMTDQTGSYNTIDINVGAVGDLAHNNCAGVLQNGDNLSAVINQLSNNNWSRVIQTASTSQVDVTQQ